MLNSKTSFCSPRLFKHDDVISVGKLTADLIAINKCGSDVVTSGVGHSHNTRQEPREATRRRVNNATITTVTPVCDLPCSASLRTD